MWKLVFRLKLMYIIVANWGLMRLNFKTSSPSLDKEELGVV